MKISLILINLMVSLVTMLSAQAGTVTISPSNQVSNLPLGGQGGSQTTQIIKIGTVNLSTTSPNGFTLNIMGNDLTNFDGATPIPLQITTLPTNSGMAGSGDFTTPTHQTYSYVNNTPNASETRDLYIKYTPASLQNPGNYSSYINLTLVDN